MLNHSVNLLAALAHIERAMGCESTVGEIAPLVTREQAEFLADHAAWCNEILAARPAIKPATEWRTPTEVRRAVAGRIKQQTAQGITRGRR